MLVPPLKSISNPPPSSYAYACPQLIQELTALRHLEYFNDDLHNLSGNEFFD